MDLPTGQHYLKDSVDTGVEEKEVTEPCPDPLSHHVLDGVGKPACPGLVSGGCSSCRERLQNSLSHCPCWALGFNSLPGPSS